MAKSTEAAAKSDTAQRETIARELASRDFTIEGVAWLEAAEGFARYMGEAPLALSLLYLRGALRRGPDSIRVNLGECLKLLNEHMQHMLDRAAELDFSADGLRELASYEGAECVRLVASGWRWFFTVSE